MPLVIAIQAELLPPTAPLLIVTAVAKPAFMAPLAAVNAPTVTHLAHIAQIQR